MAEIQVSQISLDTQSKSNPRFIVADIGPFSMVYRPGTADETVLFRESFHRDLYLRAFPNFQLLRSHVVIHIGAHIGAFAIMAAARCKQVYAIEASRPTYELLVVNTHLNRLANVTASHVAITNTIGFVTLYDSPTGTWGNSLTSRGGGRGEQVPATSLTDYFREHSISHCDLLVCNAEGAEFPIFLSATQILRDIERIAVMYHEDLAPGRQAAELIDHFEAHGFQTRIAVVQSPGRGGIVAVKPGLTQA